MGQSKTVFDYCIVVHPPGTSEKKVNTREWQCDVQKKRVIEELQLEIDSHKETIKDLKEYITFHENKTRITSEKIKARKYVIKEIEKTIKELQIVEGETVAETYYREYGRNNIYVACENSDFESEHKLTFKGLDPWKPIIIFVLEDGSGYYFFRDKDFCLFKNITEVLPKITREIRWRVNKT